MSLKYSIYLSTGFVGELASFKDPIEAYETLTHVAQTADELGFETVWLLDHFHTFPPSQTTFLRAGPQRRLSRAIPGGCASDTW